MQAGNEEVVDDFFVARLFFIGVHSVGLSILVQFRDLHSSFCTNFANVIR